MISLIVGLIMFNRNPNYYRDRYRKSIHQRMMEYQKEMDNEYHSYMSDLFQFCNQFFGSKYSVEEWLDLVDRKGWINCNPNKIDIRKQYEDYLKTEK